MSTSAPSAVTSCAPTRRSDVRPIARSSQPLPLPMVSPATPVLETRPPVTASPYAWVAASNCFQVTPLPQRTIPVAGSTSMRSSARQSITTPSSQVW